METFAETEVSALTAFLTQMTGGFTSILSCVGELCTSIVSTPFLFFTTLFLFAGGVVGILGRILSRN